MCNLYSDSTKIRTFYQFLFLLPFFLEKYPTRLGHPNESPQWKILEQFCKWFKNNLLQNRVSSQNMHHLCRQLLILKEYKQSDALCIKYKHDKEVLLTLSLLEATFIVF